MRQHPRAGAQSGGGCLWEGELEGEPHDLQFREARLVLTAPWRGSLGPIRPPPSSTAAPHRLPSPETWGWGASPNQPSRPQSKGQRVEGHLQVTQKESLLCLLLNSHCSQHVGSASVLGLLLQRTAHWGLTTEETHSLVALPARRLK